MLSVVEHPLVSSVGVVEYERAYDSRRRICAMPASKQAATGITQLTVHQIIEPGSRRRLPEDGDACTCMKAYHAPQFDSSVN
jgi:hypothetical protein